MWCRLFNKAVRHSEKKMKHEIQLGDQVLDFITLGKIAEPNFPPL